MKKRKGIILAGGYGTRLYPLTKIISKQLLPVYDKPMIFYPLSTLMQANIQEILIITTPNDKELFIKLLGNGSDFGINISYKTQKKPEGIAQSLIIAEKFLDNSPSALILGDNIFHGNEINEALLKKDSADNGATIFLYRVDNPNRYGVAEISENKVIDIDEKPKKPKSPYAVTGLYLYDNKAPQIAKTLLPSERGEFEITDLNKIYMHNNELNYVKLNINSTWLDSGTHESLFEASSFVFKMQQEEKCLLGCPEEIAFEKGWINKKKINNFIEKI